MDAELTDQHQQALITRLIEQFGFLDRSGKTFDQGHFSEALRMATSIRTLVHDTRNSRSLLGQLGVKQKMSWVDSGGEPLPGETLGEIMLKMGMFITTVSVSQGTASLSIEPMSMNYILKTFTVCDFDSWWTTPVLVGRGESLSRSQLVDMLANKDGGAHVDLLKQAYIRALRTIPVFRPHMPPGEAKDFDHSEVARRAAQMAMRTMTTEVLLSIHNQANGIDPSGRLRSYTSSV